MFGLPEGVVACLFDLDGVLTDTASVHTTAWTEMFDAYLRERAAADGTSRSSPSTPAATTSEYVDGKPREDGVRVVPGEPGHRRCPRASPDDPPDAETVTGLGNRKNDSVPAVGARRTASKVFEGSRRYLRGGPRRGARGARWCPRARTPSEVLEVTGPGPVRRSSGWTA